MSCSCLSISCLDCCGTFQPSGFRNPPFESSVFSWSANGPGGGTPTPAGFFNSFGSNSGVGLTQADVAGEVIVLDDGIIDRLMIAISNPGVSSTHYDITLMRNDVATVLATFIQANQTFAQNLFNAVAVLRGDRVSMRVKNNGSTNANVRLNIFVRHRRFL
jgi:hypothetical protein